MEVRNKDNLVKASNEHFPIDLCGKDLEVNIDCLQMNQIPITNGVLFIHGSNNNVRECNFHKANIKIDGMDNIVDYCAFCDGFHQEHEAVWLYGGKKYDLSIANNNVTNCVFSGDFGGQSDVILVGCGSHADKNVFYNGRNPKPSVKHCGPLHESSRNVVYYRYRKEFDDDAGVFSVGRDLSWPDNLFDANKIYCLSRLTDKQYESLRIAGIYIDDGASIQTAVYNEIYGLPIGVKIGRGSFNTVTDNCFVTHDGVRMDAYYADGVLNPKATLDSLAKIPRDSELWKRYAGKLSVWDVTPSWNTVVDNQYDCVKNVNRTSKEEFFGSNNIEETSFSAE